MKKFLLSFTLLTVFALAADELVVFSTGDLHGNIGGKQKYMLSLDSAIAKLRKESEIEPILIDAGDVCKGWGSAEAMATDGKITMDILSHYKYDIFVPGNHEFERGQEFCFNLTKNFSGKALAANFPASGFEGSCMLTGSFVKFIQIIINIALGKQGGKVSRPVSESLKIIQQTRRPGDQSR